MLTEPEPSLPELVDLVRVAENYDATMAAAASAGTPIHAGADTFAERRRKGLRIE